MRNFFFLIFSFGIFSSLFAQQELGTHLMRGTWQANRTNPALIPDKKLIISLPGLYNNLLIENVTYNDLLVEESNGETVLDISRGIEKLESKNQIRENLEVETITVGLRFGKLMLSLGHAVKFNAFFNYPKTLPKLIWEGNAQFAGQEVSFGSDLHLFGYNELALGAAFKITDKITIGTRAKYLNGLGDISTDQNKLNLFTDEVAYALTLDADFRVNTTGNIRYNGFRDLTVDYDFGNFNADELFTKNTGFAFDLGAHVQLGKLDLAASVLDLGGRIDWKQDVKNYTLSGIYEYQGLDVAKGLLEDSTTLGNAIDTLLELYEFTETEQVYSNELPTRYYLSGTYQLNNTWRLGVLLYGESYRNEAFTGIAAGANAQLLRWLNLGATYAWRSQTFDNLGINATINVGPLQVVAMTDNVLTAFQLYDSNSANLRLGINLVF